MPMEGPDMSGDYVIPPKNPPQLEIGDWVEIFQALSSGSEQEPIMVKNMRLAGRHHSFRGTGATETRRCLHPHEGQVTHVESRQDGLHFRLQF